jgi:hypothetical protein
MIFKDYFLSQRKDCVSITKDPGATAVDIYNCFLFQE